MDVRDALGGRAERYEVMELREEVTTVEYEANRLKTCSVAETSGSALRVVAGGREGFSASTKAGSEERLAAAALESAAYGDEAVFSFAAPAPGARVRCFDSKVADMGVERFAEIGRELVELALAEEPEARCDAGVYRSLVETRIRGSGGLDSSWRSSPIFIWLNINRIEGDDILMLFDQLGTTVWEEDYSAFARRLVGKLARSRRLDTIKPGRMPVLFAPAGALALAFPVMQALNGKEVLKGGSPLAGKIGQRLFDPKLSFVDDGTVDGRYGSAPYDAEGVPRRRNVLVDRGELRGFIYDLRTAAKAGAETTGSASRELFFRPPEPGFSNFSIEAGKTPLADMIAGIDEGILVEDLLGLGQGNILSGAFSNPLSLAFKIEKGEIVGRVKGLAIAGNVYEVLKDVAAVSGETGRVYGSFEMPWVLLEDMSVAGKG